MSSNLNEEMILEALGRLSAKARKQVLRRLLRDWDELERIISANQPRLEALCQERGLDFVRLNEEQREALLEQILHES